MSRTLHIHLYKFTKSMYFAPNNIYVSKKGKKKHQTKNTKKGKKRTKASARTYIPLDNSKGIEFAVTTRDLSMLIGEDLYQFTLQKSRRH